MICTENISLRATQAHSDSPTVRNVHCCGVACASKTWCCVNQPWILQGKYPLPLPDHCSELLCSMQGTSNLNYKVFRKLVGWIGICCSLNFRIILLISALNLFKVRESSDCADASGVPIPSPQSARTLSETSCTLLNAFRPGEEHCKRTRWCLLHEGSIYMKAFHYRGGRTCVLFWMLKPKDVSALSDLHSAATSTSSLNGLFSTYLGLM